MLACCLAMLVGPGMAAAQEASPGAVELPAAAAPFGLGEVALPDDEGGVWDLFAALPETVIGQEAQPMEDLEDRIIASWGTPDAMFGPPLTLQALSFADGDFFPEDFTAEAFVTMSAGTGGSQMTAVGRDGDLVWMQTETTAGFAEDDPATPEATMTLYTLSWGEAESGWLYSATATTPEGLEGVAIAFVETAGDPA